MKEEYDSNDHDSAEESSQFYDNQDIYEGVESLLNAPAPSLKHIIKGGKKKKKKKTSEKAGGLPALPPPPSNPEIREAKASRPRRRKGPPACAEPRRVSSSRPIDPDLLAQAFAYADRVAIEAEQEVVEEKRENKKKKGVPSAPAGSAANVIKLRKKVSQDMEYTEALSVGVPNRPIQQQRKVGKKQSSRKSKSQQQRRIQDAYTIDERRAFSARSHNDRNDSTKKSVIDDLVHNFEHGMTLRQLRKELEESKASMAHSQNVIQGVATQFYNEGKIS
mmetsp:Transcript_36449/g.46425  ORF Transcript_36449/g.46425 Transcript_36449/m.46425 type:complete len:277 (-) Transcript_36449:116-946(-)